MTIREVEMKKILIPILAVLSAVALAETPKRPMSLVVMWDGARADGIVNAELINLRKLASGTWQKGYNGAWSFCGKPIDDARAYSFANHASIMNGVTRQKHGVTFNHTSHLCDAKRWPCWLSRLLDAKPGLKAYFSYACGDHNWATCRDERVAHRDFGGKDDENAAALAALYASPDAPDAAVMMFEEPDGIGHVKGFYPMSQEYRKALETCDVRLGKVLGAIAARPTFADEDWLILVTSDHGGYHTMHGWKDTHSHTTPIILAGHHVVNGQMAGFPRGQDIAATMLAHFSVDVSGMDLDSIEIGKKAASWGPAAKLDDSLVWYYPIVARTKYLENAVKGGPGSVLFGDEEYFNPKIMKGRRFATPYLWIGGDEDVPCGARLNDSVDLFLRPGPAVTLAFWAKTVKREGRQVLFGNKDFARAGSPGFVVTSGLHTERTANGMCLVFATPEGRDEVVGTYDIEYGEWGFYAVVFTGEGQAWFCQGRKDGCFHWVCARAENALLGSGLPLCIGNDGTGSYKWNYMDFLDDIAVWKRSLTLDELRCIFKAGLQGRQLKDVVALDVRSREARDLMDTTEKAGVVGK